MASEPELRQHPALPRGAAEATCGRLALAWIWPTSAAGNGQPPDAFSLASVAAGDGRRLWWTAETTTAAGAA